MRKLSLYMLSVSMFALMPVVAGAAGTYYNSGYQNSQRYGYGARAGYNNYAMSGRGYAQNQNVLANKTNKNTGAKQKNTQLKQGFRLNAALAHEFANWDLNMKEAGSKLRYDGLSWNVLDAEGVYYFSSSTPVEIKVGARYGMQFDETSMIDDDISNGAYGYIDYVEGRQSGYAMSVGTSDGGTQMGFNVGLGLTDFFKWGRAKITPSVGYRYFKYELFTKNNNGLTMDVFTGNSSHPYVNCISVNGETQCDPFILFEFFDASGASLGTAVTGREEREDGSLTDIVSSIPSGAASVGVNTGDTYYYSQLGTSHEYKTEWAGPYIALNVEYAVNNDNFMNAGIELGLPVYDSKGNQPYRIDWAHPTSVEDTGKLGDAYHLGLNALWATSVSDNIMLSLGMTYDYYKISNATAATYLSSSYYESLADLYESIIDAGGLSEDQEAAYQAEIDEINQYAAMGWKLETSGEIKSIYSAMGIRLGVNVKF